MAFFHFCGSLKMLKYDSREVWKKVRKLEKKSANINQIEEKIQPRLYKQALLR